MRSAPAWMKPTWSLTTVSGARRFASSGQRMRGAALETRTPMPPSATRGGPVASLSANRCAITGPYFGRVAGFRPGGSGRLSLSSGIRAKNASNVRRMIPVRGFRVSGEAPQSTAKRGWIKRCPLTHDRNTRRAPLRRGPLQYHCGSLRRTSERAGRRPARRFRGLQAQVRPATCRNGGRLLRCGTDGKLSCAGVGAARRLAASLFCTRHQVRAGRVRRDPGRGVSRPGGAHLPFEQPGHEYFDLAKRLARDIGEDERLVGVRPGPLDRGEDRYGRIRAELWIHRADCSVLVEHDLVGREGDQRPAAHRIVRHDGRHLAVVIGERRGDLARREDKPAGRVQHDLDRSTGLCLADRPQNALRVVDVDVPHEWHSEQRDRLLPVDERDHRCAAQRREPAECPPPLREQELPLHQRLQRDEDEEEPEQVQRVQATRLYWPSGCSSRPSMPPATVTTWPVTCPEISSDARATTWRATSSGRATLRSAIVRVTLRTSPGSSRLVRVIGDSVQPGQTAFTRPCGATRTISFFRLSRRPWTIADFAAA